MRELLALPYLPASVPQVHRVEWRFFGSEIGFLLTKYFFLVLS